MVDTISSSHPWADFIWGRRSYLMGILNVTPDSFSDGGQFDEADHAREQACAMAQAGADVIDIGAESTRPGAEPVDAAEEWSRLEPVLEALSTQDQLPPLSVDTAKASVAEQALGKGVRIVNDINGLQGDPDMASVVASHSAGLVAMHNGRIDPIEGEIILALKRYFEHTLQLAQQHGIAETAIVLDPGIGFGKSLEQNLELLRRCGELRCLGRPLLLGASRKSVIGKVFDRPVDERLEGTLATTVAGVAAGVDLFRVHDITANRLAAQMADAIYR